ncbi:uncharacterized protein UTRI_02584 [Ustilago trichophora]|uniref:Reverse transcriptase n=1 Tax=Ustilago trichophora TaxID=86804 RepID=A0A5C3EQH3_9BASI|nr:uncharacterized protein UTRI_02584 [Ustilago trichophora]
MNRIKVLQYNMGASDGRLDSGLDHTKRFGDRDVLLLQEVTSLLPLKLAGWNIVTSLPTDHAGGYVCRAGIAIAARLGNRARTFETGSKHACGVLLGPGADTNAPHQAFFSVYIPPQHKNADFDDMARDVNKMINECPANTVVTIGGDFNCAFGPWAPLATNVADRNRQARYYEAIDTWVNLHNLSYATPPDTPTCFHYSHRNFANGTTLDLTFTQGFTDSFRTHDWSNRHDHLMITFDLYDAAPEQEAKEADPYDTRKVEWGHLSSRLHHHVSSKEPTAPLNPSTEWEHLCTSLRLALNDCRPKSGTDDARSAGSRHKQRQTWAWSDECKQAAIVRTNVKRLAKKTASEQGDRPGNALLRKNPDFIAADRAVKKARSEAKDAAATDALRDLSTALEWKYVARLRNKHRQIAPISPDLVSASGEKAASTSEKCLMLRKHLFPDLTEPESEGAPIPKDRSSPLPSGERDHPHPTQLAPLTRSELDAAVSKMEAGRAAGPDKIRPELIHKAYKLCDTWNKRFFNLMDHYIRTAEAPLIWKQAKVTIIPKAGRRDRSKPGSYRPISLLCVASKLADNIIRSRIQHLLNQSTSLSKQYAASPGISTAHALAHILEIGREALRRKDLVALVTIDVGGAFNDIRHDRLQTDIQRTCSTEMAGWIRKWLQDRSVILYFEDDAAPPHSIASKGIPQGSPLSPILWCIYIDTFLQREGNSDASNASDSHASAEGAYMDDLFAVFTSSSLDTLHSRTQDWIDAAGLWSCERQLNLDKPSVLLSQAAISPDPPHSFVLPDGGEILPTDEIRLLGVDIDSRLKLDSFVEKKSLSVMQLANFLRFSLLKGGRPSLSTRLRIASATLFPVLDYGAELHPLINTLAYAAVKRAEKAIYSFVFCITPHKQAPSGTSMAHELGQLDTLTRWRKKALQFGVRLLSHQGHESTDLAREVISNAEESTAPGTGILPLKGNHDSRGRALEPGPFHRLAESLPFSPLERHSLPRIPPYEWQQLNISILPREKAKATEKIIAANGKKQAVLIYTDGSARPASSIPPSPARLGIGVLRSAIDPPTRDEYSATLDADRWTIKEAELQAILTGLERCIIDNKHPWKRIDVFSDSQDSLERLATPWAKQCSAQSFLVSAIRDVVAQLHQHRKVDIYFHWVPGHDGVAGNTRADLLATQGTGETDDIATTFYSTSKAHGWIQQRIETYAQERHQALASGSLRSASATYHHLNHRTYKGADETLTALLLQMRCGTIPVAAHRAGDQSCGCGAALQDRDHLLLSCPRYNTERTRVLQHLGAEHIATPTIAALLTGGKLEDKEALQRYLRDLKAFLNKVWKGVFAERREQRSRAADTRQGALQFGADARRFADRVMITISDKEDDEPRTEAPPRAFADRVTIAISEDEEPIDDLDSATLADAEALSLYSSEANGDTSNTDESIEIVEQSVLSILSSGTSDSSVIFLE